MIADVHLIRADALNQLFMRRQIHVQVTAGADSRIDADSTRGPFRVIAGVLKGFDGAFKQDAVLRIEHFGFARVVVEESGVEQFDVFQNGFRGDVLRVARQVRFNSGAQQFFLREERD